MFACGRGAWFSAAGAALFLLTFSHHASSQLLDPGWQLVYPGQPAYGVNGSMSLDGALPMVRAYAQPPMYYQMSQPRAYQPAPTYYQMPRQRAYQPAPTYYQMPQSHAYQPAPVYYQQVPAQLPRTYQPATTYIPQPAASYVQQQPTPQYYASASPQQARAAQMVASPQYSQPVPQQSAYQSAQYAQPPVQQSLGAYQTGQYAQAARGYQTVGSEYQQPAPAPPPNPFAFLFHAPSQAPTYAPPAYAAPAYAPSSYGDMAHRAVDPRFDRHVVEYQGEEKPGTIIIDTPHYFLYLVLDGGRALRYGIGVGRPGFTWSGVKEISAMREWPDWYPPTEMLERRPDLPRYMPGGPENPLGARALYLGSTLYRIHGSNEPWTIGTQVSSGCIRLRNDDVIDLYGRVKIGTKVIVI